MEGYKKICFILLCFTVINNVTATIKESFHIPEKIIGGVIDIVQSHKNKPSQSQQLTYPNQQYPQYQQWGAQSNYQGQGFQTQPQFQGQQFQNQGQYTNFPQGGNNNFLHGNNFPQGGNNFPQSGNNNFPQTGSINFPQGGNNNNNYPQSGNNNFPQGSNGFPQNGNSYGSSSNGNFGNTQGYPTGSGQSYNQGQNQGQYQGFYQNNNQPAQPSNQPNQYPNTQSGYYIQSNNQGTSTTTGSGQYTGQTQPGFVSQGNGSGQTGQGFFVNGVPSQGPQGPTCVCQAWTKPPQEAQQVQQTTYADPPVTENNEKKTEPMKERML